MPTVGSQPYFLPASISPFGKARHKKGRTAGAGKKPPLRNQLQKQFLEIRVIYCTLGISK